jgi:hypothetical protein
MSVRKAGKLGRLAPHSRETHPRLMLEDYADFSKLPKTPSLVDRASKVTSWPMYLNDSLGDCTCAAVGHAIQGFTAYASSEVTIPQNAVLGLYEAVGGYVPGDPSTDQGCNEQDILEYWSKTGVAGHKISAFAEIADCTNVAKLRQALYLFGTVYLGINCPASAQEQFSKGEPWTYVRGSEIEGGHAIVLQEAKGSDMSIVTWGALQGMQPSFAEHYIEEAWVIITPDWIAKNGNDVDGFNLASLQADFASLYN